MIFDTYAQTYLEQVVALHKPSSIATESSHLRRLRGAFGDLDIAQLTQPVVQRFFTEASKDNSPKTLRNLWGTLGQLLSQAHREGLLANLPKPALPKSEDWEPAWFTPDQMRALAAADPLYAVFAETGARQGEVFALQAKDIDLAAKTLSITKDVYNGKLDTLKSRSAKRVLAISSPLCAILEPICHVMPETFLFRTAAGTMLWPSKEIQRLHKTAARLDIKPAGFHAFRRGSATLLGSDLAVPEKIAAYRLGHSAKGLGISYRTYAQRLVGCDRETADQLGERIFA